MKRLMREYENLCTLGLPAREVVPLALDLLARMVGGAFFSFIWADERMEAVDVSVLNTLDDASSQQAMDIKRRYAETFYNRREAEVAPTFTELLRHRIPLINFSHPRHRLYRSAMYEEIFRPIDMKHPLRVTVIDGEHRHGMFAALRAREDRAFSEQEEQVFLHAARHLAYAFELERAGRLVHGESIEGEDAGFLLLDASGKLLHGCELGLLLFHEATRADGLAQQAAATRETLPAALAARTRDARPSQEFVLSNRRGTFVFRPFLMRSASASSAAPVAVTVRRRGPVAARLWQESARFGLSPRERQIAVLLGMGSSYEDIADRIAVSRNTAVSYVRRTYEKLGVRQREQLIRQLLSAKTPAQSPAGP